MKIICPTCKKKTTWEENPWRPFCSERCKLIDLGKWVSEEYRIEGEKVKSEEQSTKSSEQKAKDG
ncbi:MAG: DNA gyrase inhibitor YacG [Thermodesulfovibrionales bacterium]